MRGTPCTSFLSPDIEPGLPEQLLCPLGVLDQSNFSTNDHIALTQGNNIAKATLRIVFFDWNPTYPSLSKIQEVRGYGLYRKCNALLLPNIASC
jgi:hypothetical protein